MLGVFFWFFPLIACAQSHLMYLIVSSALRGGPRWLCLLHCVPAIAPLRWRLPVRCGIGEVPVRAHGLEVEVGFVDCCFFTQSWSSMDCETR